MAEEKQSGNVAVVLVRGKINVRHDIKKTLEQLRLYSKNCCIVLPKTKENLGMIKKIKDYITWGDIDDATMNELFEKKGEEYKGRTQDSKGKIEYKSKFTEHNGKKYKKFFRLNSPKKGYGREGIKAPFNKGGALGNRGDKMKDLIVRMV